MRAFSTRWLRISLRAAVCSVSGNCRRARQTATSGISWPLTVAATPVGRTTGLAAGGVVGTDGGGVVGTIGAGAGPVAGGADGVVPAGGVVGAGAWARAADATADPRITAAARRVNERIGTFLPELGAGFPDVGASSSPGLPGRRTITTPASCARAVSGRVVERWSGEVVSVWLALSRHLAIP